MALLRIYGPHTAAGVLKEFFRELPEPIMSYSLYPEFLKLAERLDDDEEDHSAIIEKIKATLQLLPLSYRRILAFLIRFLKKISSYSFVNHMTTSNLAIVFASNLLKPEIENLQSTLAINRVTRIVQSLIEYCEIFFGSEETLNLSAHDSTLHFTNFYEKMSQNPPATANIVASNSPMTAASESMEISKVRNYMSLPPTQIGSDLQVISEETPESPEKVQTPHSSGSTPPGSPHRESPSFRRRSGSHSPLLAVGLSPRARVRQRVSRHMSINEKKERAHSDDFGKDISLIPIILTQSASSSKKEKRKSTSRERKTEAK
jgi:hypothetical protein